MNNLFNKIENYTGISDGTLQKIVFSVIAVVAIHLIRVIVVRISKKRTKNVKKQYYWRKTIGYTQLVLYFLVIGNIWFSSFRSISTYIGLLSAGIAIALKDLLTNIAGWIFIITRKPLNVGDRIEISNQAGDVIDIHFFKFTLLEIGNWVDADQSTGRIIHIPNGKIFTEPLANYSIGLSYIWNEINVLVTFESDWKKAKQILNTIITEFHEQNNISENELHKAENKYLIRYNVYTPATYTDVKDSGIMLTIRYLCDPRQRRGSSQTIWENILTEFALHKDIDFAYPTRRMYYNPAEGKNMNPNG